MKKISIGILTYNHESFIESCILSVLNLKYENLEIIISDDCSQDKTVEIVKNILATSQTTHQVILNINETNLGLAENFNRTFYEIAKGEYFITLGGDDIILDYNINKILSVFDNDKEIKMIDFNGNIIDEKGNNRGIYHMLDYQYKDFDLEDYLNFNKIDSFAPGRIFRKELVHSFKPLAYNCPTEDSVMILRSLICGKLRVINHIAVLYRRHPNNISSVASLKKIDVTAITNQYFLDIIEAYSNRAISSELVGKLYKRIYINFLNRKGNKGSLLVKILNRIRLILIRF